MRLRLFTLLLVPAIALFVLGGVIFADRQAVVQEVAEASDLAELSFQLAELDRSLGAEALDSTRYLAGEIQYNDLIVGSFSETNEQLGILAGSADQVYGEQVAGALRDISSTLEYRSDIRDGLISPLQVIDRYSHLQRILLDSLAVEVGSVTDLNSSESLLVIAALAEARSAHLNERIQVGLAIEYQTWAPGQHSAALIAIASHDSEIRFANNNRPPDSVLIVLSEELSAVRQQILISAAPPEISSEEWLAISDEWSFSLERQIEASLDNAAAAYAATQRSAESLRTATAALIGGTLVLALLVAIFVAMKIVGRVETIATKAAVLAGGAESPDSVMVNDVRGNDEIAELAEVFDHMARQIFAREEAQNIESNVLEAIASGTEIGTILSTIEPLLGKDINGLPRYRFATSAPKAGALPISDVAGGYTKLFIRSLVPGQELKQPYEGQVRAAIGFATLAQRRADENSMLQSRASRDPLTGLLNRRAILDEAKKRIETAVLAGEPCPALIYADLDGFKKVNDKLGHAAGDIVLRQTSQRMTAFVSELGGSAGRLGGDEFLLVVSSPETEQALTEESERLIAIVSAPVDIENDTVSIGVSVGAVRTRPATDVSELLNDADLALYAAKAGGRGQVTICDSDFRAKVMEETKQKEAVVAALHNSEFEPWFQPIWSDDGTSIAALESLVRWREQSGRVNPPAVFLPILEQQNLVSELDAKMFKDVCRVIADWQARGKTLIPVHLNVSPSRLDNANFVAETKSILADTGVPPELLIIEITESHLMSDVSQNSLRLQELRDLGILIAVDDFGTGYSSLAQLRDLPVDILKIDRQFISMIDKSPKNLAIVAAVLTLASELGIAVVAEGIERAEELALLGDFGCKFAQGFLLGRPQPKMEIEALLARSLANISSVLVDRQPSDGPNDGPRTVDEYFNALGYQLADVERRVLKDSP